MYVIFLCIGCLVGDGLVNSGGLCSATVNNRFTGGQVSNEFAPEEDSPLQSQLASMLNLKVMNKF